MLEGLQEDEGASAVPGALFGPGRGEARSDGEWGFGGGTKKPGDERDNLWIGGGTKKAFAGLSGSPGQGETGGLDIGWKGSGKLAASGARRRRFVGRLPRAEVGGNTSTR